MTETVQDEWANRLSILLDGLFRQDPERSSEPDLEERLRAEAQGILAWAVRGCLDWQAVGLNPPGSVKEATQAYRDASDPIRDFLADRCILDPKEHVSVKILWEEYLDWLLQNGIQSGLSREAFTRRLEALGCDKIRRGHNRDWTWSGITRRADSAVPVDADKRTDADMKLQ